MNRNLNSYKDILEPRRNESSNFMWISRELNTVTAYKQRIKPTPNWHKQEVLKSARIADIIEKLHQELNVPKQEIEQQICLMLKEIGFNKRLSTIRWLGLVLTKICLKVCSGIYVDEENIMRVKKMMGNTPVIFLPSHRSYADFILMSYICFTYDIEIPAIAAGMDFHGMWGMGSVLRDTGAFFMRRTYNDDNLYWDTFRQYIHQLITKGDLPIEFFIEGTRSRTGKSLSPKFGLLSMVLKPFFTAEVPDILLVPINISYDRVLEEKLFAFELLGIPKPKESTSGFFKSLSIIKERYGNIYVDFAEPISARNFFKSHIDRSVHNMQPIHLQELTQQEKEFTSQLAYNIIDKQQKSSMITTFNLIALSLTNNFILGKQLLRIDAVVEEVKWSSQILEKLGVITDLKDPVQDVWVSLNVHKGLVQINNNLTVDLVKNSIALSNIDVLKLKGHALSQDTMNFVVPFITLQVYVNPLLHYMVKPAIIITIFKYYKRINKDILFGHFCFLRSLFSHEFVTNGKWDDLEFEETLRYLQNLELITLTDNECHLVVNDRLQQFFCSTLEPFIFTYYVICKILIKNSNTCEEKAFIIAAQAQLESFITKSKSFIHPYCLNLDTISNCLSSLTAKSALKRKKINGNMLYEVNVDELSPIIEELENFIDLKSIDLEMELAQVKICLESKL